MVLVWFAMLLYVFCYVLGMLLLCFWYGLVWFWYGFAMVLGMFVYAFVMFLVWFGMVLVWFGYGFGITENMLLEVRMLWVE